MNANYVSILNAMINDPAVLSGVDVDKAYGDQCWDLVELYAERCGVPKEPWAITLGPEQAAKEAWTVFDAHMQKYFDRVPVGSQQAGDIAVYGPHGQYTEGHIAIWADNRQVFEQNADPNGALPHVYPRPNTYLLGSLRIKKQGGDDMIPDTQHFDALWRWAFGPNSQPTQQDYDNWVANPVRGYNQFIEMSDGSDQRRAFLGQVILDEEGVRILAVGILERPEPLTTTPDLSAHIGGYANSKIKEFWYSPEGRAANKWRQNALKKK